MGRNLAACAVEVTFKCTFFRDGCPTLASAFVYAKDLARRHVCAAQRSVPVHVAFASGKVTWNQGKGVYQLSVPEDSPQQPAWGVTPVSCSIILRRPHDGLDPHAAGLSLRHARKAAGFPGALEQRPRVLSGPGQASSHDNVKLHYTFATTPGWVSPKDLAAGSLVGGVQTTGAIQNGNLQGSLSTSRATNLKREFERCLLTRSTDPKQSLEIIKREPLLGSMTGAAWVS